MLSGSGHDLAQKFIQIKQEGTFSSGLLSEERSNNEGESSFRVLYYGGATGAVPFNWELRPGTPKHPFSGTSLPPLTPPPSYQFSPNVMMKSMQKPSKPNKFLQSIFPSKKIFGSPSFSSSSISSMGSSSSYSVASTPMEHARSRFPRSSSAVQFEIDEEVGGAVSSDSFMCFGLRNGASRGLRYRRGGFTLKRKLLFLLCGHGKA